MDAILVTVVLWMLTPQTLEALLFPGPFGGTVLVSEAGASATGFERRGHVGSLKFRLPPLCTEK